MRESRNRETDDDELDELEKVKLEAKEILKASTKIIANNISLKHQLDTVEKDATKVDIKSREFLKEIDRIKKIRKETEASTCTIFLKQDTS